MRGLPPPEIPSKSGSTVRRCPRGRTHEPSPCAGTDARMKARAPILRQARGACRLRPERASKPSRAMPHPTLREVIRLRHRASYLAWGVTLAAFSSGCTQPPSPRALFVRAVEQIERATVFEYHFELHSNGRTPALAGSVTLERLDLSGNNYRARVNARIEDPVTGEPLERVEVVRGKDDVYALDEGESTVWFSSLYAAGPTLMVEAEPALMYAFFDPRSLEDEAGAAVVEWEGRREVAGTECDAVCVTYEDDNEDSRWCFDDEGYPRLLEWIAEDGSLLEISDLRVGGPIVETTFEPVSQEGFALREAAFGPPPGSPARDWELPLLGGGSVSLADLRGRVVVLDFWATWCPPCLDTLGALDSLHREMAGRPVSFFAVNTMESGDPAELVERLDLSVPVLLEGDDVHDVYTRGNLPAMSVIDAAGRHAGFVLGYYGEGSERYARHLVERALSEVEEVSSLSRHQSR